jgi:hypothetical protein
VDREVATQRYKQDLLLVPSQLCKLYHILESSSNLLLSSDSAVFDNLISRNCIANQIDNQGDSKDSILRTTWTSASFPEHLVNTQRARIQLSREPSNRVTATKQDRGKQRLLLQGGSRQIWCAPGEEQTGKTKVDTHAHGLPIMESGVSWPCRVKDMGLVVVEEESSASHGNGLNGEQN